MPPRTQDNIHIAINTPLGKDALFLRSFRTEESLGRPFVIYANLESEKLDLALDSLLGKNVSIRYAQKDGKPRYLNGLVARFSQAGFRAGQGSYRATIVPWLWFLTRTSDCRIFQNKNAVEIIEAVFGARPFSVFDKKLAATYKKRDYCVQYRETDFAFVSRLMEEEGIYYYFTHENGKHTMVLADNSKPHPKVPGYESIRFYTPARALASSEWIKDWSVAQQVQPGAYGLTDYDFTNTAASLTAQAAAQREHPLGNLPRFDYPGDYDDHGEGESLAKIRLQSYQARYEVASGESDARGILPGHAFALAEFARKDQNREYLVTSVERWAKAPDDFEKPAGPGQPRKLQEPYGCEFSAIEAKTPFRPARTTERPIVHGPQTAVVCGKSGEEITTDEHGRVKVQFHWDRDSAADENSSCWIRVAQVWAGKGWGGMFIPRHGQEVIVEFLEGDPDRPIITGRVYNGTNKPPYDLPARATLSAIKSQSSKGGGGFNEIRFEDKKGEEQLFIHAQRNADVRVGADSFESVGHDRHLTVGNNQAESVKNDLHEKVGRDKVLHVVRDRLMKVDGKEAIRIAKTHNLEVCDDMHEMVHKNRFIGVEGKLHIKADEIVLEAETHITIRVGGNYVAIDSSGITIGAEAGGATLELMSKGEAKLESAQADVTITSPTGLTLKSDASATIQGGSDVSVQSSGTMALKGAMVLIN